MVIFFRDIQILKQEFNPFTLKNPPKCVKYQDANLYHDIITGRSVTATLHFLNKFLIDWYSKKQATVETATYGSEYISARTCVNQIMDLRTTLRYLGVPIRDVSYMFGDNESVVNSSTQPATLQVAQETQCSIFSSCS